MKETVMFGRCLIELLTVKGWSAARLSREINLDPSYIRKWIKGERVPPIKSDYIEQIVDNLCSFCSNSAGNYKKDYLAALDNMEIEYNAEDKLKDILLKALTECQLYSLKFNSSERILKSSSTEEDIINLLFKIGSSSNKNTADVIVSNTGTNESSIPSYIKGREQILLAYIALLKAAGKKASPVKIITSFQSENYFFNGFKELEECYDNEVASLLSMGFTIYQPLKLDINVGRSIKIVRKIIQHTGIDKKYYPFYFEQYFTQYPACEILIVENMGALVCFSTEDAEYIDSGFFYNDSAIVKDIFKHYLMMIEMSKPLIKIQTSSEDYFNDNVELNRKNGDILCIRDDLTAITQPYDLWVKYLTRTIPNPSEREEHLKRILTRYNSFYEQIERYKYYSIFPIKSIEYLLKNKKYFYDNIYRQPEAADIAEHLDNLISMLRKYENFNVALINENQVELLPITYWEVKGDYSVVIDMWTSKEIQNGVTTGNFLTITEGTIVESFRNYYFDIWNKITPKYRDKRYILYWLETQLSWYKSENNLE